MRQTLKALALIVALLPGIAAAQNPQFPQTLPGSTVVGRLGSTPGPAQAVPFAFFYNNVLNSLCQTNNAFPVYSTAAAAWVCSTAPAAATVFAGPTSGGAAQPTFRALIGTDLPFPGASSLGGAQSKTCSTSNWFNTLSTGGVFGCSQPAFSDISGSIAATQLPSPSATTLGGVKSLAAVSHQFLTSISTAGQPTQAQPGCTDLSDASVYCAAARGQQPGTTTNDNASTGNVGEYVSASITRASPTSLTTATPANLTTGISLTAGDWDASCSGAFTGTSTVATLFHVSLSPTTATEATTTPGASAAIPGGSLAATDIQLLAILRFSLSTTTTVFCVVRADFGSGTVSGWGLLSARRRR